MLCFNFVANTQYDCNDFAPTHTYTGTVQENKGCCAGKSQYLRILLKQCGISSCCISTFSYKEMLHLRIPMLEKYFSSAIAVINGKELSLNEAKAQLPQELQNEETPEVGADHCINLVHLDDDKYGIHGIFAADTCPGICYGFMPINDIKYLQDIFNFTSYTILNHGCGFDDFIRDVKPQELSDEEFEKIEKEYFTFAKKAIKQQVLDNCPKDLSPSVRLELKNFTSKLRNCTSFEQVKELFDNKRSEKTKFGKVCEEIFEKTFSDELGIFALTTEASENRAALEGCPLANAEMPVSDLHKSIAIAEAVYNQIFGKQDLQK